NAQEAPAPPAQAEAGQRTVRIADAKLDVLLNLASELVTVQAQLSQTAAEAGDRRFIGIAESVRRLVAELRTTAMEMRLVRVDGLFSRYGRMVRDVSSGLGKEVELLTEGGHTELDKNAVEGLVDPLMHLIRNAVDHGIEAPADRERAGKPRTGSVRLSARHDGGSVVIRVSDDGRGIDWDRVAAIAVERGLAPPGGKPSPEELEDMLFAPGFSTQAEVSNVSGRGVGLDVVKTAIERLGGGVEISSAKGSGTEFSLSIPLTIAIIDGFLAVSGRRSFIVPLANVLECFERKRGDGVERLIERSGGLVPIVDVRKRFSVDEPPVGDTEAVLVVSVGSGRIALAFDSIVGGYQTVIKPLGELARYAREVAGAAILADGSIALILDVTSIAKSLKDD
ncbi:MAG: chemotaxis protein CheA, partial [Spirochaetes bacterium]|nr:chemotaxis protein CheA [Spirochaetota bacterium]